jgi:thioredoxin 1
MRILTAAYEDVINNSKFAFVRYTGDWCQICKAMTPIIHDLDDEFKGDVDFYEINLSDNMAHGIAIAHDVRTLPTVLMFHYGKLLWRIGGTDKNTLTSMIRNAISNSGETNV